MLTEHYVDVSMKLVLGVKRSAVAMLDSKEIPLRIMWKEMQDFWPVEFRLMAMYTYIHTTPISNSGTLGPFKRKKKRREEFFQESMKVCCAFFQTTIYNF